MFFNKSGFRYAAQLGVVVALVVVMGACASTKPPTQKLAQTEAIINQAEQVGAQDYAPLEIREARKKLQRAKEMVSQEKYKKASRLAERAEVDAELAEAKALSEKAQSAVRQLRESIKLLEEEIKQDREGK